MSNAKTDAFLAELTDSLGKNVSADPQICRAYDHDLGEMPAILLMLFKRTPKAVALPHSAAQVRSALSIAARHKIPVTPRAQASSGYGGAMPVKGGLLVDMSRMKNIINIDENNLTCEVEPGVVWSDLEAGLNAKGLACCIQPTSAPSSTVGGMFAMGGMGIGSTAYGNILDVVEEIDVIDPDGEFRVVKGKDLEMYAFSQGTLGIITRLKLKCRKNEPLYPAAYAISSAQDVPGMLKKIQPLNPYSISVLSAEYCQMQAEAAKHPHPSPVSSGFLMEIAFEKEPDPEALNKLNIPGKIQLLPQEIAQAEWDARFYPMRIKRHGPALLVGEYVIDAQYFPQVYEEIRKKLKRDRMGFEAFVDKNQKMAVLIYIQDSAEDILSLFRMGKAMLPLHIAAKYGGTVYATGLWFNSRSRDVLGADRMNKMQKRKMLVDPQHRMNPGKVCGGLKGFLPFSLLSHGIWLGTRFMGPLSGILRARPRRLPHQEEV